LALVQKPPEQCAARARTIKDKGLVVKFLTVTGAEGLGLFRRMVGC